MATTNVFNLAERRQDDVHEASFLTLIDSDIARNPASVQPVPKSLMQRISALVKQADDNTQSEELREG